MAQEFLPKVGNPEAFSGRRFNPAPLSQQNADGYNMMSSAIMSAGQTIGRIAEDRQRQDLAMFQVEATEFAKQAYTDLISVYRNDPLGEAPEVSSEAYREYVVNSLRERADTSQKQRVLENVASKYYGSFYGEAVPLNDRARNTKALEDFSIYMGNQVQEGLPANREAIQRTAISAAEQFGVPRTAEAQSWLLGKVDDYLADALMRPDNLKNTLGRFQRGEEGTLLKDIRDPGKRASFEKKARTALSAFQKRFESLNTEVNGHVQSVLNGKGTFNDASEVHKIAKQVRDHAEENRELLSEEAYQAAVINEEITRGGLEYSVQVKDDFDFRVKNGQMTYRDVIDQLSTERTVGKAQGLETSQLYAIVAASNWGNDLSAMSELSSVDLGRVLDLPQDEANALFNGPGTREYKAAEAKSLMGNVTAEDILAMDQPEKIKEITRAGKTLSNSALSSFFGLSSPVLTAIVQNGLYGKFPEFPASLIDIAKGNTIELDPMIDESGKKDYENSPAHRNLWSIAHSLESMLFGNYTEQNDPLAAGKRRKGLYNLMLNLAVTSLPESAKRGGPIPADRLLEKIPDVLSRINLGAVEYQGKFMVTQGPPGQDLVNNLPSATYAIAGDLANKALQDPGGEVALKVGMIALTRGGRAGAIRELHDRIILAQETNGNIGVYYDTKNGAVIPLGVQYDDDQILNFAEFTQRQVLGSFRSQAFLWNSSLMSVREGEGPPRLPAEVSRSRADSVFGEVKENPGDKRVREHIQKELGSTWLFNWTNIPAVDVGKVGLAYIAAQADVPGLTHPQYSKERERIVEESFESIAPILDPKAADAIAGNFLTGADALATGLIQPPYPQNSFLNAREDPRVASKPYGAFGLGEDGKVSWAFTRIDSDVVRAREESGIRTGPRGGYYRIPGFESNVFLGDRDASHVIAHRFTDLFGRESSMRSGATINLTGQTSVVNRGTWFEFEDYLWQLAKDNPDRNIDLMIGIREGKRVAGVRVSSKSDPEADPNFIFMEFPDNILGVSAFEQAKQLRFQDFRNSLAPEDRHYAELFMRQQVADNAEAVLGLSENME